MLHHSLFGFKNPDYNPETQNLTGWGDKEAHRAKGEAGQDERGGGRGEETTDELTGEEWTDTQQNTTKKDTGRHVRQNS